MAFARETIEKAYTEWQKAAKLAAEASDQKTAAKFANAVDEESSPQVSTKPEEPSPVSEGKLPSTRTTRKRASASQSADETDQVSPAKQSSLTKRKSDASSTNP